MKPLVYIAGPYTHPDPILNTRCAIEVAEQVAELGGTPLIPHLSLLWHLINPKPVDDWYAHTLELLEHCDALLRFEGASVGADLEVDYATEHDIPVYYGTDDPCLRQHLTLFSSQEANT